jgi:hypothetical protein
VNTSLALDKPLRELHEGERNFFLSLKDSTDKLTGLAKRAYQLQEVTNVDVSARINQLPLTNKATFISSIRGLSILEGKSEYPITVIGTGLGPGQSGMTANVEVLVDGKPVPKTRGDDTSLHDTAVVYPSAAAFKSHGAPKAVITVPAVIRLTVIRKGLFRDNKTFIDTKLLFTLYPRYAGSVKVTADVPTYAWVSVPGQTDQQFSRRTADCGKDDQGNPRCGRGGVTEELYSTPVAGGNEPKVGYRRVINARCECGEPWWERAGCIYVDSLKCDVVNRGTQVFHQWQQRGVWATRTVKWDVEEYKRTGTSPITLKSDMVYGQPLSFCLPSDVDHYLARISTVTSEEFELTPQESLSGRLEYLGTSTCEADKKLYEYRVPPPL